MKKLIMSHTCIQFSGSLFPGGVKKKFFFRRRGQRASYEWKGWWLQMQSWAVRWEAGEETRGGSCKTQSPWCVSPPYEESRVWVVLIDAHKIQDPGSGEHRTWWVDFCSTYRVWVLELWHPNASWGIIAPSGYFSRSWASTTGNRLGGQV